MNSPPINSPSEISNLINGLALPKDEDGPVFSAPWEAQAFAIVVSLFEQGYYTWPEWAEYLSAEIASAKYSANPEQPTAYYEHWLAAAEKLVIAKGITTAPELATRKKTLADATAQQTHVHNH